MFKDFMKEDAQKKRKIFCFNCKKEIRVETSVCPFCKGIFIEPSDDILEAIRGLLGNPPDERR